MAHFLRSELFLTLAEADVWDTPVPEGTPSRKEEGNGIMELSFPCLHRWTLILVAAFSDCASAAGPTVSFEIPAGQAPQTLRQFYLQSQVRLLYLADTVKGVETQAIAGEFEASEALAQMLRGTGLDYEFEGEYSAVIRRAIVAPAESRPTSPPFAPNERASIHDSPSADARIGSKVEEVLVTGSLIHGVFDVTSPLIAVDEQQKKRTAYATVQDAVQALPLAATVTRGEVLGGGGNYNLGAGINLRGLGDAATLVLVNGRRQPVAGVSGDFVDVSNIPWSMVQRIEVLPDGGSALYGSDAIAGVVNILLRTDLEGTETQLRYGTAADGGTELLAAQLVGHDWNNGHWLAGYQYYERTSLAAADRDYAANADKRPLGGRDHRSISSNPGNIIDPQTLQPVFGIPRGQNGTSLGPNDLLAGVTNYRNQFAEVELLPHKEAHNVYFTASQSLREQLEIFVEGRYGQRDTHQRRFTNSQDLLLVPATNPFFVSPIEGAPFALLAYDFANELGPYRIDGRTRNYIAAMGLNAGFDHSWRASMAATYGAEELQWSDAGTVNLAALNAALADPDPATAFNPFGDGSHTNRTTIEAIRATNAIDARSQISSMELVADGPLFRLPSGEIKAAIGTEYRQESLNIRNEIAGHIPTHSQSRRNIGAIFAELAVPLIGSASNSRAVPRLELSLAGRYEQYDDFGRTYNPKIGLRWMPLASIKLRASWGTSFRAPNLLDLDESRNVAGLLSLTDPRSPSGRSTVLGVQGGNSGLKEERARTWTAGIDLAPSALPDLRLSLTGYSIEYGDQVIQPGPLSPFDLLLEEDQWAPVITRDPSQAQIDAICAMPRFLGHPAQCRADPPTVLIDIRKHNLAITRVRGLDFTLDHSLATRFGHFNVHVNGAHVFHFERAFTKTAPRVDIVNTVHNPVARRLRGTVEWRRHAAHQPGFAANLTANYTGGYRDRDSQLRPSIDAWTTFDVGLSYRTRTSGRWTDDTELAVNIVNLTDKDPPFVDREWGYDLFNAQPTGRVFSAYVSKKW